MAVDFNDKRLTTVKDEELRELNESNARYDQWISDYDEKTQQLIDNSAAAADRLAEEQRKQFEHQANVIEQQREQANKDYIKEQSGAYVDFQKESNKYGGTAERLASQGLTNSGYHESTQVSIYNTYQNRVAMARDSFERTKLNFDNAFKEAQLQNSSIRAEIALNAQKEQLEFALSGLQYKNNLLEQKASAANQIKSVYNNKWQTVLDQINTENTIAEQARQFDLKLAEDQRQFDIRYGGDTYTDEEDVGYWNDSMVGPYGPLPRVEYNGNNYNDAVKFMVKNGVDKEYASTVMTQHDFDMAKATGKRTDEVGNYATYMAYLKAFVDHAIYG
jgi:hypothetical protein